MCWREELNPLMTFIFSLDTKKNFITFKVVHIFQIPLHSYMAKLYSLLKRIKF